ncbi:MAG: molecular chaperone SurA, partial [Zoogloea sp.]|nr:molecular chaperone SurA [Zoogloea sp.]
MKRTLSFTGALLVAIAAHAQAPQAKRKAEPVEVDRIVAVVNNEVLTQAELQAKVAQVTRQLGKQGTSLPPEDVLQRQILDRMVMERLQVQLAAETGLRVDDGAVERTMKRIADANRMTVGDFRAALERDGIAWDAFREDIRNELLLNRVREREVDSRVVVSDAEVDSAIAGQEQSVSQDEEFKVAHILLRVPEGASPEQLARLRRKAD